MKNILLAGQGGRESSIAKRIHIDAPDATIHAVMEHANPTIADIVQGTGGQFLQGDPADPQLVGNFGKELAVDLGIIASDVPLSKGVVNSLEVHGIPTFGPNQEAARIEWDKAFMRELINDVDPLLNLHYALARTPHEVQAMLAHFKDNSIEVVVKPLGLTGGKGVKVMGPHFDTYEDAAKIALSLLDDGDDAVLFEEKVDAASVEFTIQAFTDGKLVVTPPVSYDYPYRYDGDTGPGTGGMGSFTQQGPASYLTQQETAAAEASVEKIVQGMANKGLAFKGVLNVGFFATPRGLKVIECNARPGDPECINMMLLAKGNIPQAFYNIATGNFSPNDLTFPTVASAVIYLVTRSYATSQPLEQPVFSVDEQAIQDAGAELFFASAEKLPNSNLYRAVGSSRVLAVGALGKNLPQARAKAYQAINQGISPNLDYRQDIAATSYVDGLRQQRG